MNGSISSVKRSKKLALYQNSVEAGDPTWISDYVQHLLPMLDNQINSIVTQPDWSMDLVNPSDSETNIYMMDEIEFESEVELEKSVRSASHHKVGHLVNLLINDIGTKNKVRLRFQNIHNSEQNFRRL